jgi:hypothetical protein
LFSLALFEERLIIVFSRNNPRIFRNLFMTIVILVLALRQLYASSTPALGVELFQSIGPAVSTTVP